MNYGNVKYSDIADGPGVRTSLFVSGCTHHCPGCFQPETWDFAYGRPFTHDVEDRIVESLQAPWVEGLTVLGGEPMEPANQKALAPFLQRVRAELPEKTIWLYTGDVIEDLLPGGARRTEHTDALLRCIDVLVDGRFEQSLRDVTLRFCGSSNQRVLDLPATLEQGAPVPWEDDPEFASHAMVRPSTNLYHD